MVDVYRDGVEVGTAVIGGSFDNFIGQNGGATLNTRFVSLVATQTVQT